MRPECNYVQFVDGVPLACQEEATWHDQRLINGGDAGMITMHLKWCDAHKGKQPAMEALTEIKEAGDW